MPDKVAGSPNTVESIHARWTVDTLAVHQAAIRAGDLMYQAALREADVNFHKERDRRYTEMVEERDRRYTEVALEREKALKIKESADLAALALAREIQTYKDEKANQLREQISSERGLYATKADVIASSEKIEEMIKPLAAYVAMHQGRTGGLAAGWGWILGAIGAASAVMAVVTITLK